MIAPMIAMRMTLVRSKPVELSAVEFALPPAPETEKGLFIETHELDPWDIALEGAAAPPVMLGIDNISVAGILPPVSVIV